MHDVADRIDRAQALIFDCDGTLVDSGRNYADAWGKALRDSGHELPHGWYEAHSGYSTPAFLEEFERAYSVRLDRARIVAAMQSAYDRRLPHIRSIASVEHYVRRYHGRKRMAVASNGSREVVHATLHMVGLHSCFTAIVTLDDVLVPKPSPKLFQEAARQLDADHADCLVIEDSAQGFAAARAGGFPFIDVREIELAAANLPPGGKSEQMC